MWMKNYAEKRYYALFLFRATRLIVSRLVCAIDQAPPLLFIIITVINFLGERRISMIPQVSYRRRRSELVSSSISRATMAWRAYPEIINS